MARGTYLTPRLPTWIIPLTKGTDRVFTLVCRTPEGSEIDWDADVYLDIDTTPPTRIEAVVSGSRATLRIESTVGDTCVLGTTWRVVRAADGTELPVMVGTMERNDGA